MTMPNLQTVAAEILSEELEFPDLGRYATRVLNANDYKDYRDIRLEALKNEGEVFGPTYEDELKFTETQWRARCTETKDSCMIGLFDDNRLIGIMGAKKWDGDETGKSVLWWSAYLKPEYRGKKIAAKLYQARLKWAQEHPQFERAVLFIREGNVRSINIHEKQGAELMYAKPIDWPNRPSVTWYWYQKRLTL